MAFVDIPDIEDTSSVKGFKAAGEDINQRITGINDASSDFGNHYNEGVNNVKEALADNEKDAELLRTLQEEALNSLRAIWEEKMRRIKKAWEDTTPVTVKSIIDEAAPYASSIFSDGGGVGILKALYFKIDDLTCYLLGVDQEIGDEDTVTSDEGNPSWMEWLSPINAIAQNIGLETIDNLADNPAITGALSQLSGIRAIAAGVEGVCNCVEDLKKILKFLEPLKPVVDVLIDFILAWKTGGTSAGRAINTLSERAQFICQKLLVAAIGMFRELIFNIKFNIPTILVESLRTLDVSDTFSLSSPDIDWGDVFGFDGSEEEKDKFNNFMGALIEGKELEEPDWSSPEYSPDFRKTIKQIAPNITSMVDALEEHTKNSKTLTGRLTLNASNKLLGAAVNRARRDAKIPIMTTRPSLIEFHGYKVIGEPESRYSELSPVDQSLSKNQISSTYFTESTIRKISKKIID